MQGSVLYLGDTSLDTAAAYLAGLMSSWGWQFDYVPSDQSPPPGFATPAVYVISDYPAARLNADQQRRMIDDVAEGAGLLMIGGWESFHGLGGDWDGTAVGDVLPVTIGNTDDRLNCDHPVMVRSVGDHPVTRGLPWSRRPPLIGGLNRVTARTEAATLLEARHFHAVWDDGNLKTTATDVHPLLVVQPCGEGRTAALMTDVAPHWVGPLVDWGDERVTGEAPGAPAIEVGSLYAQFVRQLLEWVGGQ